MWCPPKSSGYQVDGYGFLVDSSQWNESFAGSLGVEVEAESFLIRQRWRVIRFIRNTYSQMGKCPLVYQTCRALGLTLEEMKALFPAGYLRGACRAAGMTYGASYTERSSSKPELGQDGGRGDGRDACGYLKNYLDWNETFPKNMPKSLLPQGGFTSEHLKIIKYIRNYYAENGLVPTVYETCEANAIGLDQLEELFPQGYQRGAVKMAGVLSK